MDLSDEEVIQKILTRLPNFETEEDVEKVADAITWVCGGGQFESLVSLSGHGDFWIIKIETLRYAFDYVELIIGIWFASGEEVYMNDIKKLAINAYDNTRHKYHVREFENYIRPLYSLKAGDYHHITSLTDAYVYLKANIPKIKIKTKGGRDYVLAVMFPAFDDDFIRLHSAAIKDVREFLYVVMAYYHYFCMQAQDVKVAQ